MYCLDHQGPFERIPQSALGMHPEVCPELCPEVLPQVCLELSPEVCP